jgi:plastocyanin
MRARFRSPRRAAALLAVGSAAALTFALGCFSGSPTEADDDPETTLAGCRVTLGAGTGAVQGVVAIKDFKFAPDTLRVPRGTTVTWVNCDDASGSPPHTSTSDANAWTSQLLPAGGATYSRKFDQAGAFPYHCEPHPSMRATVIVE